MPLPPSGLHRLARHKPGGGGPPPALFLYSMFLWDSARPDMDTSYSPGVQVDLVSAHSVLPATLQAADLSPASSLVLRLLVMPRPSNNPGMSPSESFGLGFVVILWEGIACNPCRLLIAQVRLLLASSHPPVVDPSNFRQLGWPGPFDSPQHVSAFGRNNFAVTVQGTSRRRVLVGQKLLALLVDVPGAPRLLGLLNMPLRFKPLS